MKIQRRTITSTNQAGKRTNTKQIKLASKQMIGYLGKNINNFDTTKTYNQYIEYGNKGMGKQSV